VRRGSVVDFLGGEALAGRGADVQSFYKKRPFPGYAAGDDAAQILDRGRRSPFLAALDAAIAPDATVLDCGCGTAQVASFLALAGSRRRVVGVDGTPASLAAADEFRGRAGIRNLQLVRADLFELPLAPRSFRVVHCRGVVHHTADPLGATERVADLVAPGGILLLGIYESMGRRLHCWRRGLGKLWWGGARKLDPILRRRDLAEEKKLAWIDDQYHHPLEHLMPASGTMRKLKELGFDWVRTVPPIAADDEMFEATPEPSGLAFFMRRAGWFLGGLNDEDAGLICLVARRR
jgi:SAM-dependent methyltransferase